jgi:HD-GYP domain-containing protein (c-di-GMP phosphodiesterase class II)
VQVATLSMLVHSRVFPKITGVPLEDVGIGAILLDMGMALADTDPGGGSGSLSHHEYQMMKLHATMGFDFLNRTGVFSNISLAVVHHHHERYDGKGYPDHLNGDAIPKGVQIAALCDTLSALTADRGYRKAVTTEQALQTMKGSKGAHEPVLFQNFEKIIREVKY